MYEARGDSRRIPTRANSHVQVQNNHMVRLISIFSLQFFRIALQHRSRRKGRRWRPTRRWRISCTSSPTSSTAKSTTTQMSTLLDKERGRKRLRVTTRRITTMDMTTSREPTCSLRMITLRIDTKSSKLSVSKRVCWPQNHSDSGKGSFGQVVKAFDHKTQSHVALKIVRNEKRFHRQAQEEIAILEALRRQVRKKK